MGNRAVIQFESMPEVGIYLHWNGGPESVLAFLHETRDRGGRSGDTQYAFAALVGVITDLLHERSGNSHDLSSVGVGPIDSLDQNNYDNGVFVIDDNWRVIKRKYSTEGVANTADELRAVTKATGRYVDDYDAGKRYEQILAKLKEIRAAA